jgi:hypothetical protein
MIRTFECYCSNCGVKYDADIFMGPISSATKSRCCSMKCVKEIDDKYYKNLLHKEVKTDGTATT